MISILRMPMPWIVLVLAFGLAGCRGSGEQREPGRSEAAAIEHGGESGHEVRGGEEALGQEDHEHENEGTEEHEAHAAEEEGRVVLTAAQRQAVGLTLAAASFREIPIVQELPGEIAVNADRLAHIVPRFSGIAREVRKNLGDTVKEGEVLAVIEANESLALYEVKSLIAGTVIEKHITLGEFVSDEQDIYVVADLSSVWANVTVYARDLERIRVGQAAKITAAGISDKAEGKIDYIDPVVGEATRTSIARIVLPNPRRVWRPGLFVTAHVRTDIASADLVVPDKAIQTVRGRSVVFVEDGDGFRLQPVGMGRTDGEWTEIVSGLSPGARVAVENSFILKSELLKSEAGHGHAH